MTHLEQLKAMLEAAPGGYLEGTPVKDHVEVTDSEVRMSNGVTVRMAPDKKANVGVAVTVERGYSGFTTFFVFDKDGSLLDVAAYE